MSSIKIISFYPFLPSFSFADEFETREDSHIVQKVSCDLAETESKKESLRVENRRDVYYNIVFIV